MWNTVSDTQGNTFMDLTRSYSRNASASSPTAAASRSAFDPLFDKADNPFPWMAEIIDLKKNVFETRVIEYQMGGALSWD